MSRRKGVNARRRRAGLVAALAGAALLIGGTLAWQSISQRALNNFKEDEKYIGARLHDDFADDQEWTQGANKDVYVENYSGQNPENEGDDGRPVFVRVKMAEYMEIGEGAGLFEYTGASDPIDYQTLDQAGTGGTRIASEDNKATPVSAGDITKIDTWPLHIPKGTVLEDDNDFHEYWAWEMGGSKMFMPTFNKDNESLLTDRTTNEHDKYVGASAESGTASYADPDYDGQAETHTPKLTQKTASVITMAQWMTMGHPQTDNAGNAYWVGDTDGWFYWSSSLEPGEATGLLLNGVKINNEPDEAYYYSIHVTAQMATAGDWGDEATPDGFYAESLTEDGKFLLDQAADLLTEITSVEIAEGPVVYVEEGKSVTLTPDIEIHNPTGAPSEQVVTWTISPDAATDFTDGTLTTAAGEAGSVYSVTVTTAEIPTALTDTVTVVVYPAEGVGTVGPMEDGKFYVDYGDNTYKEVDETGTLGDFKCAGLDKTVGNADDKTPVLINDDDVKLLGPNADGSYYIKGADGKLGTADDPKRWPNTTIDDLTDEDPNVTYSIEITQVVGSGGGTNSVKRGENIKYTAVVKKTNTNTDITVDADNQNVKWELINGSYADGTAVNNSNYGKEAITLTAGETENIATDRIHLRATSEEGSVEATVKVTVTYAEFIDENGIVWFVLNEENGYKLIMTKYVYGKGTTYNLSAVWTHLDTAGNNLKSNLKTFYTNMIGDDIKAAAVAYKSPLPDVRSGAGGWNAAEKNEAGKSHPDNTVAVADGSNAIFVLSISETHYYLGDAVGGKVAYNVDAKTEACYWWLRSPDSTAKYAASVGMNGAVTDDYSQPTYLGYRAALWVKSDS